MMMWIFFFAFLWIPSASIRIGYHGERFDGQAAAEAASSTSTSEHHASFLDFCTQAPTMQCTDLLIDEPLNCAGPAPDPSKAAFATLLLGESYVPSVKCLLKRMADSTYPLLVVHDDSLLEEQQVLLINDGAQLKHIDKLFDEAGINPGDFGKPHEPLQEGHGVGTHTDIWLARVQRKLALWLLTDYDWIVASDSDILWLNGAPNELMKCAPAATLSAVPVFNQRPGEGFNSGVLGFKPSVTAFRDMMHLARNVSFQSKYFEKCKGDQSIINYYFRERWSPWPKAYNVEWRFWEQCNGRMSLPDYLAHSKTIHFVGEGNKPWEPRNHAVTFLDLEKQWERLCSA